MKYRYKLLELRRNRDNLMAFLETYESDLSNDPDCHRMGLTMDEKLRLYGEITRIQKEIEKIEHLPIFMMDHDCGDYEIAVPSMANPKIPEKLPKRPMKKTTITYPSFTWNL